MAVALSPLSLQTFFDVSGKPIPAAAVYFYAPGTLTPVTVYQDNLLSVPYTQPVTAGGSGRIPPIYVGETDYRARIFDAQGSLLEDIPFLPAAVDLGTIPPAAADTAIATGDIIWSFNNAAVRLGWVRCNGNTIGSATSGATERANADTQALFLWLWGQDTGNQLAVTPSKGASAAGDWAANKAIALPDLRGRSIFGMETMGRTSAGRLTGATFATGNGSTLGSYGGAATATLVTANLAAHSHTITATQAAHSHTITLTDPGHNHGHSDPGHAHSVSDPGHAHTYDRWTSGGGSTMSSGGINVGNVQNATGVGFTSISINGNVTGITNVAAATGITAASNNQTPAITASSANAGSGTAFNIAPPFAVLCAYMRL